MKKNQNEKTIHSLLNPSYTFENFVEGGSNEFAVKASKGVSKKPGEVYNPLFIYGGVGVITSYSIHYTKLYDP